MAKGMTKKADRGEIEVYRQITDQGILNKNLHSSLTIILFTQ